MEPESPGHHFEKGSDLRMLSVYQAQCLLPPGASCPAGLAPHGHSPACAMSPIPSSAFLPPRTCLNSLVSWVWQTPASSGRVKRGQSGRGAPPPETLEGGRKPHCSAVPATPPPAPWKRRLAAARERKSLFMLVHQKEIQQEKTKPQMPSVKNGNQNEPMARQKEPCVFP